MLYLIDTHILLWALSGSDKLPQKAAEIMEDPNNTCYYSIASVWEVGIKHGLNKDDFTLSPKDFAGFCDEAGFSQMGISVQQITHLDTLRTDNEHKDPFDRILLAQAKCERMRFLTHDAKIPGYHEECVVLV